MKKKKVKTPVALIYLRFLYNTVGRLFPGFFAHHAYKLWTTVIRFKTPAYEQTALSSAITEEITVNGETVTIYLWQDQNVHADKTLLFVHGWAGRATQIVNYIKPLNAMGYRIISFDALAHGKSSGKQTSLFEFTDIVFSLRDKYKHIDAAITHSVGGMVLMYAMSLGLKIDRVAFICPPQNFEELLKNFKLLLRLPKSVENTLKRITFISHGQVTRDAVSTVNNAKKMRSKALFLHDQDDDEFSWHDSEEIAKAWKGAKFIKTRGLGHRRIIHDKAVIQSVLEFLGEG